MTKTSDLCTREYHDFFGKPYNDCPQCFVRDNGPWPINPLLMTDEQFEKWRLKEMKKNENISGMD